MAELVQLPDEVNLAFVAGDTFRIRVRVIDPNTGNPIVIDPVPGSPGEAGEYAFCAQIIKASDRSFASEFTISSDTDAPTQAVILTLPPTETNVLVTLGDNGIFNGLWDLQVTFPGGDIRTVAKGTVTCYIDVSCRPGTGT